MPSTIAKFAADPLAFFNMLRIPSAHGTKRFSQVMGDFQRKWFAVVAPSLLAVAAGKQPPITRFWSERTKGASKDSDCACVLLWLLAFSRPKLDSQQLRLAYAESWAPDPQTGQVDLIKVEETVLAMDKKE